MENIKKTINLQKKITTITEENKEINVAYLSGQISEEYNSFSVNIQILDKVYAESNKEMLKQEYESFRVEVEKEALACGWSMFTLPSDVVVEEPTETIN